MQSMLNLDQGADVSQLPADYQSKIKPLSVGGKTEWYFPKGTVFDGDHALALVKTGQASPIDEECAVACGMSAAQLEIKQRHNLAALAGIKGKEDLELFMAGVIDGYEPGTTDAKPIYINGVNWDNYLAALKAAKTEEE